MWSRLKNIIEIALLSVFMCKMKGSTNEGGLSVFSWSESNQRDTDILLDEVMESQYHQFETNSSLRGEPKMTIQGGMRRVVVSALYGVLVLLLLILLMVTGIKFSQLNKEVTEVKLHLERISHRIPTSSSSSASKAEGGTHVQDVLLQKLVPVRGTCGEGWVSFHTSCYLLSTTAVTWSKAEEQCRAHGAHLVVLNNVEELDYISKIVDIKYNYWIGLVEREHEGHWSWVDGTDFNSTPTFWDDGQPDNWDYRINGEDCGQLHASSIRKRKLWNDADCNLSYKYICEKRA
ncbi:asialoglycoprotein receptor-like 1 isoform X1 [Thunnus albacares]|uniref:asialoglycoprotein receptor-like 1 isoform X1 n=2 Tax=Thunnus albacares TaxID=8236 RepID=UPI001CF62533|nr:asialoglycoprotein receptor-like 1 isoform X1 [Thunnus albacares]